MAKRTTKRQINLARFTTKSLIEEMVASSINLPKTAPKS